MEFQAVLDIREASSLITSHNPTTWLPRPDFPALLTERDFDENSPARRKVKEMATRLSPARLLKGALSKNAALGPPTLASVSGIGGVVLKGNLRAMAIVLAYAEGHADTYRAELLKFALRLGFSEEQVSSITSPVLVRVLVSQAELARSLSRWRQPEDDFDEKADTFSCSDTAISGPIHDSEPPLPVPSLADAGTRTAKSQPPHLKNSAPPLPLSPEDADLLAALDAARRLSAPAFARIGRIQRRLTLREAMDKNSQALARLLVEEGIITQENQALWLKTTSLALSRGGKSRLELLFLARAAQNTDRLRWLSASEDLARRVERLVPAMVKVSARANGMELDAHLQLALDALHGFMLKRQDAPEFQLDDYLEQVDFTRTLSERSKVLARCLHKISRIQLGKIADEWGRAADFAPPQLGLFEKAPQLDDPFQIWRNALEQQLQN